MVLLFLAALAAATPARLEPASARLEPAPEQLHSVAWTRDGRRLVFGGTPSVVGRDLAGNTRFARPQVDSVPSVARFHHLDRVAFGNYAGQVQVIDDDTGEVVRAWDVGPAPTGACALPDRPTENGSPSFYRAWCHIDVEWITDVAVAPDDSLVVATGIQGSLLAWRPADGARVHLKLRGDPPNRLEAVAFSPDGRFLAVAGSFPDGGVRLLDLDTGHQRVLPSLPQRPMGRRWATDVAFSPDGSRVAIGHFGGGVEVRAVADGDLLWSWGETTPNWVWPVVWTADGGSVLAANPGTLARLDAASGQIQASVPYKQVADMELSPDGERLVVVPAWGGEPPTLLSARTLGAE